MSSNKKILMTFLFIFLAAFVSMSEGVIPKHSGLIHIYSDKEMADAGFPGTGTEDNPYQISNKYIKSVEARQPAVIIENTSAFIVITDCVIESGYVGIWIKNAADGSIKIEDNKIRSLYHSGSGISLINTDGCIVHNNSLNGFYQGIHLNESGKNSIIDNTVTASSSCGIHLRYSSHNTITGNTIQDAPEGGISAVIHSNANIIKNNRFLPE